MPARAAPPDAHENILRALDARATLSPALAECRLARRSKRVDLGGGVQAVREHDRLWLERGPANLSGSRSCGGLADRSELPGLRVRGWSQATAGGEDRKIQDVFVDAKVPRSEREGGRSSCAVTRSSPCPGSSSTRG